MQLVSCPLCGERIPVDEDTPSGAVVEHDGKKLRLEKEFGAFVLSTVE
ncbi:MAG: sulfonate ABC transporter [Nitrospinae bacterium]|nr:sulfonate ABC transporter [Nitrospinota bacterium]